MTIGFYIHHTTISAGGIFTYTIGILKEILKSKEVEKVIIVTSSEVNDKIREILYDSKLQVVNINRTNPAVKVKLFIYFLLLTFSILLGKIIPSKKLTETLVHFSNKINPYTKVLLKKDLSVFHVNELISGIKSDLAIKFFGSDLEILRENANRAAAIMQDIPGAEDVRVEQVSGFPQVEIVVDRKAIARHKINIAEINEIVETAVGGKVASTVVEEQKRFAILVRFPVELRRDIPDLERLLVPPPEEARIPLGELAKIREVEAPAQVSRENGMRRVVVECNIRGRDMGGFVAGACEH